ncbi:hypothetical protein RRF57_005384 [Xylaria bambusicola]|uniref:Uncharacterized protein n=1 Tax=Xylaria bambusicola TaxID=326684 RepID=A0AAN7UQ36_9PEZI
MHSPGFGIALVGATMRLNPKISPMVLRDPGPVGKAGAVPRQEQAPNFLPGPLPLPLNCQIAVTCSPVSVVQAAF